MWHLTRQPPFNGRASAQSPMSALSSVGADRARPGIVHRLDRNTTGAARRQRRNALARAGCSSHGSLLAGPVRRCRAEAAGPRPSLAPALGGDGRVRDSLSAPRDRSRTLSCRRRRGQGRWWWPRPRARTGPSTSSSPAGDTPPRPAPAPPRPAPAPPRPAPAPPRPRRLAWRWGGP